MNESKSITSGYGAIVTAVLALITYALALRNGFAFDDVVLIPNDARVINQDLRALVSTPYWNDTALTLYRPLTTLSFAADWFISNGSTVWFHFTNVLWHAAASVLVYALLLRYFAAPAALLGGAIFAVHPVHVEAVANVVGRGELMATTIVLAGCVLWPLITQRSARVVIISALYFLALCAKESAAVLPALLVLLDAANGEWSLAALKSYARRRAPELVALVAVFAVFMLLRTAVLGGIAPAKLDPAIEVLNSGWHRRLTALQAWPVAARLLIFPWTLLADYGPRNLLPIAQWNSLAVLGATIILALVGGGVIALYKGRGVWALALLWYPVAILPVSNFIVSIGVLLAERTLYMPSVAFSFAVAGLFTLAMRRSDLHKVALVLALVVPAVFAIRTAIRIPDWRSTDSIMLAQMRDRPQSFRGQWHMARMARNAGNPGKALQEYDKALKLWPYRESLVQEAAAYASSQGQAGYARDVAFYGAQRWPSNVMFHRIIAGNALDLADTATARRALTRALQLHPGDTILNQMWRAAAPAK